MQLVFWLFQIRLLGSRERAAVIVSMTMRARSCRFLAAENEIIAAVDFRIRNDTDTASIRLELLRIIRPFRNNPEKRIEPFTEYPRAARATRLCA
ncbi:hypothetical protein [Burkholderia cenocepacia]|uniref:hypothetical protein n=1 Tax=Burkholderia cenocepacia TaxID=95486 RepID=UPI0012B3C3AF|nr:hypothetical protein [Burkholderia cenocepacia]MBR7980701.1 hypothetical protein [Burkholderia cenocepacia]